MKRYLTFIPIWGYGYEWDFQKPSALKMLYHGLFTTFFILLVSVLVVKIFI